MIWTKAFRSCLVGGMVLLFLLGLFTAGCGKGGSDFVYTKDDHNPALGFSSESTEENAHQHTVWIWYVNLSSPPAAGVLYTSSNTFGHTHAIFLSEQQLSDIKNGNMVIVNSSIVQDHFHTWVISRGTGSHVQGAESDLIRSFMKTTEYSEEYRGEKARTKKR